MRIYALHRACRRLAAAVLTVAGLAGCATGGAGGLLPPGQELTPQAEYVLDHAPKVAPVARELTKTVPPSYVLEPGDTVLVEAVRFDSPLRFPADQVIQPDGTIDLGEYGRIVVAGKRIEEVEACVEQIVNEDPRVVEARREAELEGPERVNVRLIDPRGSVFYVLGAVNSPGAYPYTGRETVL
ncbi:MAG TPA: polysaccharide biosynthesis/export family protein, partial [Planctomycetaceae bacterium]